MSSEPQQRTPDTSDADADSDTPQHPTPEQPENEKLVEAFQSKYIRLRLDGTRLPKSYTITLRLPSANDVPNATRPPSTPRLRRRRKASSTVDPPATDSELDSEHNDPDPPAQTPPFASDAEDSAEAATIRTTNAYTGASNTIGSIHQRHWFLTLDKRNSGFVKAKTGGGEWVRSGDGAGEGFETFYVRGREVERSVVTGRLAGEVEGDEGVEGFVGRKGWRAVLE